MTDKSREELESELREAQEAKAYAEDKLSSDRLAPLSDQLNEAEAACQQLFEQLEADKAARETVSAELEEALEIVDDVDTLNEELSETNSLVSMLQEKADDNLGIIAALGDQIIDMKNQYNVHVEELQMAELNNEHTGLLERRLKVMESHFNEIVAELHATEDANEVVLNQLREAIDARESTEYILEDVEDRLSSIPDLKAHLASLDEEIGEKSVTLDEHQSLIEELRGSIDVVNDDVEATSAAVSEHASEIESIEEQIAGIVEPAPVVNTDLEGLLTKINETTSFEDVYALGESFNKMGFMIGQTTGGRAILCKVRDNKAVVENVLEDYVFISDPSNYYERFTDGLVNKIHDFVKENVGAECKSESVEQPIMVVNEDKQFAINRLVDEA